MLVGKLLKTAKESMQIRSNTSMGHDDVAKACTISKSKRRVNKGVSARGDDTRFYIRHNATKLLKQCNEMKALKVC